jgi:hypothetical protein
MGSKSIERCFILRPETRERQRQRQPTQHDYLPSLLGNGDEGIEIVYGEDKNILYLAD